MDNTRSGKWVQIIKENKKWIPVGIVLLLSFLLRILNLHFPLGGDRHAFRQTQVAITIQSYLHDGWSLFRYELPVFGQPWQAPMEFPIYQSVVYFVMKIFHRTNIDVCCRFVSLCIFYLSLAALKKVADLIVDRKTAYIICAVYLFAPFTIFWSRTAMIDYMAVLFALVYVWGLYSWLTQGRKTFAVTILFGCLAYLQKATTMFPYVFFLAFLILGYFYKEIHNQYQKVTLYVIREYCMKNKIRIMILALLCILPVIPGVCWIKYADVIKEQSVFARAWRSDVLQTWNYGTIEQKFSFNIWLPILKELCDYIGGVIMVVLLIAAYCLLKEKKNLHIIISSILVIFMTIFSLINLYWRHDYYMIALSPFISIVYGTILFSVTDSLFLVKRSGRVLLTGAIAAMVICAQIRTNGFYLLETVLPMPIRGTDEYIVLGNCIGSITTQNERIVTEGEDVNPAIFYYADRKGIMTTGVSINEWFFTEFLRQDNYTTLITHSADFTDMLAQYYDVLIQYPGLRDRHIYKFYQELPPDQENLIKIKYGNIEEPLTVDAEFVNIEGESFHDTINLLVNTDEIYYNIEDSYYKADPSWTNIESIHIEAPEGIEIAVEY